MASSPTSLLSDLDLFARLVAFDSTSHRSNLPIADFICEYLDRSGARIVRLSHEDGSKMNIIASIGPETTADRQGLILSGHMDVVPATEPDWVSDPFQLHERDGALYGRGTCDMKGFVALAMNLFANVDPATLNAPLVLMLTCDEEVGSLGAKTIAEQWPSDDPLPRHVIIGEPTSLRAVRMHKGHLKMRITISGQSAHSGSPNLGVNAIEPAADILQRLIVLREEYQRRRSESSAYFPEVPFTVLNIARIHGGNAINVIPDSCVIDVGVRVMPGERSEDAAHTLAAVVGDDAHVAMVNDNPSMLLADDAPIHRSLCQLLDENASHGVSFASDAGWLSTMGMDCVLFGPGTIEAAHKPNEFVPINEMDAARKILEKLLARQVQD